MDKLAIDGGMPVRKEPFPPNYLGVALYGEEEKKALMEVVDTKSPFRHYGIGKPHTVADFEAGVRAHLGCKHALAVSSGTGALLCAMAGLGVGPGDEVILPAFGWYADFYAIALLGALPVFADIDETLSLDPVDFQTKITAKTKAVVVVNFQGGPAHMDEIMKVARAKGIKVVEDVAQAFGGEYKGRKLGTIGDIGIASFQQNKMLSSGEGGMVVTNDSGLFARAVRYHDLGFLRGVFADQIEDKALCAQETGFAGSQFRMSELQGAVMGAQLKKLGGIIAHCRKHAARFRETFKDNKHFTVRYVDGDCGIAIFLRFRTAEECKRFDECLAAEGVPLGAKSACRNIMHDYPITAKALHHPAMPPFGKGCDGAAMDYVACAKTMKADAILERCFAMSIGPLYTERDMDDIIAAVKKVDANLYP